VVEAYEAAQQAPKKTARKSGRKAAEETGNAEEPKPAKKTTRRTKASDAKAPSFSG
jgi:hypothetical protein